MQRHELGQDQVSRRRIHAELRKLIEIATRQSALPRLVCLDAADPRVVLEHRRQDAISDLHMSHIAADCRYTADALAS
jgi:hypothetical protein